MILLLVMLLAWGSAMIAATDGENKAANHTQTVAIANQILEYMRRDPYFWSPSEFVASNCPRCWPTTYNDTPGTGTHPCSMVIAGAPAACTFNWVATAVSSSNNDLAQLTVILYYQGANHQTETYTVMGMDRNL
jgi:hypothetical protein